MKHLINNKQSAISNHKSLGFTFIELLVVISIIAILTMFGVNSYKTAQQKSRDNRRKVDFETIRSALEMYRADNGLYPAQGNGNLSLALVPNYIQSLPIPPSKTRIYASETPLTTYDSTMVYISASPNTNYILQLRLELNDENYQVFNP